MNDCGICTECCKILQVAAEGKLVGNACRHQTVSGCQNYQNRSDECKNFDCLYRRYFSIPKPSECGWLSYIEKRKDGTPGRVCVVQTRAKNCLGIKYYLHILDNLAPRRFTFHIVLHSRIAELREGGTLKKCI